MKKLSFYLLIPMLGLIGISSCQEVGQETLEAVQEEKLEKLDPVGYENKLKELALFMGEVFKDPAARRELFNLANADEYKEDITYSLKTLLATNQNPMSRQRSAIANAFYKNSANHRKLREKDFNEEELIKFINSNDITMLAPYMVGYFNPDEITELTVSYWTEDTEQEDIQKDPNGKGKTPGFKLKLNEGGNFIRFGQSESDLLKSKEVVANDDYAMLNPTIVFGDFEEDLILELDDNMRGKYLNPNLRLLNVVNNSRCEDLTRNSIVRLTMPKFRLTSSIRNWPHHDRMSVVIVLGTNPGGSAYSNRPFFEQTVPRGEAANKNWVISPTSFLVNNWQDRQVDLAFVVFNRKRHGKGAYTAVVTVKSDSSGNSSSNITQTLTVGDWSRFRVHANATFNRCGTIIDPYRDKGFGLEGHNGTDYGIERLNKFEFILVPEITR